jgi:hypothetical protein
VKSACLVPDGLPLQLEAIEWIRFAALVHAERIRKAGKKQKSPAFLIS